MKKTVTCLLILLICGAAAAVAAPPTTATAPLSRDVLAHSAGGQIWFARVSRPTVGSLISPAASEQTEAFVRQNGPGQSWQPLPPVVGRAVAIASRPSQLVLLMKDGQWLTLWSDGSATGQPLPAGGQILALTDDGDDLWAVGSVPGGMTAADEALVRDNAATQPSTNPAAATTAATALGSAEPTTHPTPENGLVVFRQVKGRWRTFAELPHEASFLSDGAVSLIVIDESPIVSYRVTKGAVKTLRWNRGIGWKAVDALDPMVERIEEFKLFTDGTHPMLWWTTGTTGPGHAVSPGELLLDRASRAGPVKLEWKGTQTMQGLPAITFFGGFIRLLGPHGDTILEQRYEANGQALSTPAPLALPGDATDTSLMEAIEGAFLVAVAFSVGASIYRQLTPSQLPEQREAPVPAPLTARLGAGLVDLLPVFGAVVYLSLVQGNPDASAFSPSPAMLELCAAAVGVYLLHVTVLELLTGRSLGKWLFGLKVVTIDGKRPTAAQTLIRNLLRLVDPLVMILLSPLRQRSADVVAGTMVVRVDETQPQTTDGDGNSENKPSEKDSQA